MRNVLLLVTLAACDVIEKPYFPEAGVVMDAPVVAFSCPGYCNAQMAACTGGNLQWESLAACMATCPFFSVGIIGETTTNTLACRVHFAQLSYANPDQNCLKAGPSGGGECGVQCQGFCTIVLNTCPAAYSPPGTCPTACATYPQAPPYSPSQRTGNSVSCRLSFAISASIDAPANCPNVEMASPACM